MAGARHPRLATLHAWAGVVLALPLCLLGLSGAMLLFRDALFVPAAWRVADPAVAAPDAEVARLLALPALRHARSLLLARGVRDFHFVTTADGGSAWWRVGGTAAVPVADVPLRLRLEPTVLGLHRRLLLGDAGAAVIRVLAPLAALTIVAGLWLWWPLRRGWRRRDLLVRGDGRPQLLRAHLALGSTAGLLLLVHAVSGALLANDPAIRPWLQPLADARTSAWPGGTGAPRFAPGDAAAALAAVRALYPSAAMVEIAPRGDSPSAWSLMLRLPGEDHPQGRSTVVLDVAAGHVLALRDARLAGAPGAYDDTLLALHGGTLFGDWQRWPWLLGGIASFRLALLGGLSWWRRPRRR
jgi:uncharacterized iron-regulated membrane protein